MLTCDWTDSPYRLDAKPPCRHKAGAFYRVRTFKGPVAIACCGFHSPSDFGDIRGFTAVDISKDDYLVLSVLSG